MIPRVVLDTSVIVAGLRSRNGASFQILSRVGAGLFVTCLSVPLVIEYEDVLERQSRLLGLTHADIGDFLDYVCSVSERRQIYYLWRPVLKDPSDDFVLELAVEAGCDAIVTHNVRDFAAASAFDVEIRTPGEFLRSLGEVS
jgi:putative PIN family toxin of toxin-antitoxin system